METMTKENANAVGPPGTSTTKKALQALQDYEANQLNAMQFMAEFHRTSYQHLLTGLAELLRATQAQGELNKTSNGQVMSVLGQILRRIEVLETNNQQIRTQCDQIARVSDKLTDEFITRNICDPVYKELLTIFEMLFSHNSQTEVIKERIIAFFEAKAMRMICPEADEAFNPNEHEVLASIPGKNQKDNGKITRTVKVGLADSKRIVRKAGVEIIKSQ